MSPRGESVATTASAPGMSSGASCSALPISYRTPATGSFGRVRLTEMTWWPREAASRTMWPPVYPVPPKTTMVDMCCLLGWGGRWVGRRHDGRVDLLCDVAPDVGVSQPLTANTVHVAEPAGGGEGGVGVAPRAPTRAG